MSTLSCGIWLICDIVSVKVKKLSMEQDQALKNSATEWSTDN